MAEITLAQFTHECLKSNEQVSVLGKRALSLNAVQQDAELLEFFTRLSCEEDEKVPTEEDKYPPFVFRARCVIERVLHNSFTSRLCAAVVFTLGADEDDPRYRLVLSLNMLQQHFKTGVSNAALPIHLVPIHNGLDPLVQVTKGVIDHGMCSLHLSHSVSRKKRVDAIGFIMGEFTLSDDSVFKANCATRWVCELCLRERIPELEIEIPRTNH